MKPFKIYLAAKYSKFYLIEFTIKSAQRLIKQFCHEFWIVAKRSTAPYFPHHLD